MTPDELRSQLGRQYELVCFEDLADLRSQHRAVFDLFKKHRRVSFEPNQRLVLYSSHEPEQEFVDHIQRAAARIDISNFFILFATPHDLDQKTQMANSRHGHDDVTMTHAVHDLQYTKKFGPAGFFSDYDSMCAFPFMQLDTEPGGVMPCCKFNGKVFGELDRQSLNDVFHGSDMEHLRAQMRQGIRPIECRVCWDHESTQTLSLREHGMTKFGDRLDQGWVDNPRLRSIQIIPSNICNFNCRICNPVASSKIAQEEIKYATGDRLQELKRALSKNKDSFNPEHHDLQSMFKDVEYLHVLGGEPFAWPRLGAMVEKLIDHGYAQNINIELHSNGSIDPTKIIKLLQQFRSVEILLSIDDVGPRFEIQRGGNWDQVLANIQSFCQLRSERINVKIAPTVNIQNLLYLGHLVDFCHQLGIDIVWWYLETPAHFCIDNVTKRVKDLVWTQYSQHAHPELRAIANRVCSTPPVSGAKFLHWVDHYDQRRSQNFQQHHSEIIEAMQD